MFPEKKVIGCPFCGKETIKVIHAPETVRYIKGTWGGRAAPRKTKEKYEVISPCPNCGKSVKEIQRALDEGKKDPKKDKKILKRLKEQGLDFSNIKTKF